MDKPITITLIIIAVFSAITALSAESDSRAQSAANMTITAIIALSARAILEMILEIL
jgi:hypothetical protein